MKIDFYNTPSMTLKKLLDAYKTDRYLIMEDILSSKKAYSVVLQDMVDICKLGFEDEEVRHRTIIFKLHKKDKKYHQLPLNNFLSLLIIYYAFMAADKVEDLREEDILDFSTPNLINYIVEFLERRIFKDFEGDFYSANKICDVIFYNMRSLANSFCLILGMGMSYYNIWQATKKTPELAELMYGSIDTTMQPKDLEEELNNRTKRFIELINTTECDLQPLFKSGKNMSFGQTREMFIMVGLKSDIDGVTIPIVVDSNLVTRGVDKPSSMYIGAGSARKSLMMSKQKMGDPGAFSKRINALATSPGVLRKDYEECNSVVPITYDILDDNFLLLLNNRHYYDSRGNIHTLSYDDDKHLIGKRVRFASPCTCNSKEGICRKCYGGLFEINKDLFSAGSYGATKASNPLGQAVLGSKHHQSTDSSEIVFSEKNKELVELDSTSLLIREDFDIDNIYLILGGRDGEVEIEQEDDRDSFYVTSFLIVDKKGNVLYDVKEEHGSRLYLSDRLTHYYKKMKVKRGVPIPLEKVMDDDESSLFTIEIKSKELTDPIKAISAVLKKDSTRNSSISEICQKLAEEFISVGINNDLVHIEAIARGLIVKESNNLDTPDWSMNGDHDDFMIRTPTNALVHNPSITVSLTSGYLKKQLLSPETYKKTAPSHLDAYFVRDLANYIDQ